MSQKNYQIIIDAEQCDAEPAVIVRRLAKLGDHLESAVLESLSKGLFVYQKHLSYEDAFKIKETLTREGIAAQIQHHTSKIGEILPLDSLESEQKASVWEDVDVLLPESSDEQAAPPSGGAGGWDALFPDLIEAAQVPPRVVVETRASKPRVREADGPTISSWQPAMDTQEGVIASVPGVKSTAKGTGRAEQPIQSEGKDKRVGRTDRIEEIEASRVFTGTILAEAVVSSDRAQGPYAPTGFDPRPDHVPLLAAIFSGIAPGAGQIYNGQNESALKYGMRFWWIRPWIASIRQAYNYGIKVRDYQEPRPDEASLSRALRYVAGWYSGIIVLIVLIFFGANAIWEARSQQDGLVMQVELSDVVERAVHDVRFARMSAFTAVNKFLDEQNKAKQEFTMTAEERAHRLYVVGYSYCVGRQYSLCEATMRRVTSLGVRNRDAYRLQAWASMQIKEGGNTPLPEVSEVSTLFEFELLQDNDPDRDIVQPAVDLMLSGQGLENLNKDEADEADKVKDFGEID